MKLFEDKRGFVDTEILMSVPFLVLFGFSFTATILGYIMGNKWGLPSLPIWQLIAIIVVEFIASYFFVARQ
jgi:hypothetical protein